MRTHGTAPVSGITDHGYIDEVLDHGSGASGARWHADTRTTEGRFFAAVRHGADADELNGLLASLRREQKLRRDAARVAELADYVARGDLSFTGTDDLAQLLSLTREELEVYA